MRLLIDMNLSPRWVGLLTNQGVKAVHWSSLGPPNAADIEIMAYDGKNDYVVFTHDLDFGAILAATRGQKPSVLQVRSDDVRPERLTEN